MSQSEEHRMIVDDADASTAASNDTQETTTPPPYLKLIADCWEHIFDYLSFKNIFVMGETCKRMNQMAGYYIREYHPDLEFHLIEGEIRFSNPTDYIIHANFYRYITKLHVKNNSELNFFANVQSFEALKALIIGQHNLTETEIGYMQNVLKNVETIQLVHCRLSGRVFEQMAKHCSKLKYLHIHNSNVMANHGLFLHYFPTLEHLQYRPLVSQTRVNELKVFLEKHSNLKRFAASNHFLWENRDILIQTNVQLDLLNVHFDSTDPMPFDQFIKFLRSLYARGLYKTLKLTFRFCRPANVTTQELKNAISTLPALRKLVLPDDSFIDLPRLSNLKEFYIEFLNTSNANTEILATSLPKLERLGLGWGFMTVDALLPFIRHSKYLETIECPYFADKTLDLNALNEERKKHNKDADACPISIRVPEYVHLDQTWNSQNLKLDLVKIERFELNYDFCYNF